MDDSLDTNCMFLFSLLIVIIEVLLAAVLGTAASDLSLVIFQETRK